MRDSNGKILCLFSYFLGILESNSAELWAIKYAVDFCLSNSNLRDRNISIIGDSKTAVAWINNGDFGNLDLVNIIFDIRNSMISFGNMEIVYASRSFNSFADSLAKMGSSHSGDFVVWDGL